MKKPEYAPPQAPSKHLDPLQLLDYRCHLPEGRTSLGTAYPKQVSSIESCTGGETLEINPKPKNNRGVGQAEGALLWTPWAPLELAAANTSAGTNLVSVDDHS